MISCMYNVFRGSVNPRWDVHAYGVCLYYTVDIICQLVMVGFAVVVVASLLLRFLAVLAHEGLFASL